MKRTICSLLASSMVLTLSGQAYAQTASSADDICPPATDPCVISQGFDVIGPLDFGARTVRIVSGGRLKGQPDLELTCGALEITNGLTATGILDADGDHSGDITVTVRRACSGDGTTPCLDDSVCAAGSLGTCSAGNTGTIAANGKITSTGGFPGRANIRAAGDVTLERAVNFSCTAAGYDGGNIDVESYMGSVIASGEMLAKSGVGTTYDDFTGLGGHISVRAAVDVDVSGGMNVGGAGGAGSALVDAGRDIIVSSHISCSGGGGLNANGGEISLTAGRDIIAVQVPGGDAQQEIAADGGTSFYFYGYGAAGAWYSGYGGYQYFDAGDDIALGQNAKVHSDGGWASSGGKVYLDADGSVTVEGEVRAVGVPPNQGLDSGAGGGYIVINVGNGVTLAPGSLLKTASPVWGGGIRIEATGPVALNGEIDVRGNGAGYDYDGEHFNFSQSGYIEIEGAADVSVGGRIRMGGPYRGEDSRIDVCRLELTSTGEINGAHGSPNEQNANLSITVHESMTTAFQSKLLADTAGAQTFITYRDPKKPPVLDGTVSPAPVLAVNPSLVGCPVCGNSEIDQGESCDDGNTTSGDGCRSDCQDEGCIAQTPGYPSTAMCDDGDACTLNDCDPIAHACENPVSCEEGVACTIDACAAGACQHTPDDSLCDDFNDCTDDLCNATTGCVHAGLTGGPCNDDDFCTPEGTCDDGDCLTAAARLATDNRLKIKVKAGAANDILKATIHLPLSLFSSDPTSTGATVVVADEREDADVDEQIALPSSGWIDKKGTGEQFSYKDALRSAKIKRNVEDGVARASIKIKGADLDGVLDEAVLSLSMLFGTDPAIDDCLTAREVPCTTKGSNVSCQ